MFELIILCILYLLLITIMAIDLFYILIKQRNFNTYFFCKLIYFVVYSLIPIILHIKYSNNSSLYPWNININYSESGIDALYLSCLFSFIGYIFLTIGHIDPFKIKLKFKFKNKIKIDNNIKNQSILRINLIILFILGIFSLFMWSKAYGGIFGLIREANAVRSGFSNVYNHYSFTKRFVPVLLISSYGFIILLTFKSNSRVLDLIFWMFSTIGSILYLLASDGRMTAGFYFIGYIIIYIQSKSRLVDNKINIRIFVKTFVFLTFILIFIMKMDDLTYYLRNGEWISTDNNTKIISNIISELSFVEYSNQLAIINSRKIGLQIVNDVGYGFYAWIPSSTISNPFNRLWSINSILAGATTGEVPCGIVTQGYYDLRLFGVISFTYMYGKLIKKVDNLDRSSPFGLTLFVSIFYSIVRVVSYGMIYDFLQGLFNVFIFIVLYKFIEFIVISKKTNIVNTV